MCCMTSLPVTGVLSCVVNQASPFLANALGPSPRKQEQVSAWIKSIESRHITSSLLRDFISIALVRGQKTSRWVKKKDKTLWCKHFGFFSFHLYQGHAVQRITVGSHQKLHESQRQPAASHFQCLLVTKGIWRLGCSEKRDGNDLSDHGCRFEAEQSSTLFISPTPEGIRKLPMASFFLSKDM